MTESNQGPATPGTAARCEVCNRPMRGLGCCLAEIDETCAAVCLSLGYERLKAENASLRSELGAAENRREYFRDSARVAAERATQWAAENASLRADLAAATPALDALAEYVAEVDRDGWPSAEWSDANLERMRDALRVAGRMGEPEVSAAKTPSDSESLPTRASLLESLRRAQEDTRLTREDCAMHYDKADATAAAAEQRAEAAEKERDEFKADCEYLFGLLPNDAPAEPTPRASSRCPICGTDFPHQHTYEEEYKHRVRFARKHAPPAKSKYREWADAALHDEERSAPPGEEDGK